MRMAFCNHLVIRCQISYIVSSYSPVKEEIDIVIKEKQIKRGDALVVFPLIPNSFYIYVMETCEIDKNIRNLGITSNIYTI